jgi:hypothetical protein
MEPCTSVLVQSFHILCIGYHGTRSGYASYSLPVDLDYDGLDGGDRGKRRAHLAPSGVASCGNETNTGLVAHGGQWLTLDP